MLRNARGRHMQYFELYPRLGLSGRTAKLPDDGLPPQIVDGAFVRVLPKAEAIEKAKATGKRFVHRVLVTCSCGRHVPFGRIEQHLKAH